MTKFLMAVVENGEVIKEESVGFIPVTTDWPKAEDGSFLRRPVRENIGAPENYDPHLHLLKTSWTVFAEYVSKTQIAEDKPDDEVRALLIEAVGDHCEKIINDGVYMAALESVFKCDDKTMLRLANLSDEATTLEAGGLPVDFKFRTAAGKTVHVESAAYVINLYDDAKSHVQSALSNSAKLAKKIETINHAKLWALTVTNVEHWSIT